jgi:two-component system nitrogen regulation response regulator GlnG
MQALLQATGPVLLPDFLPSSVLNSGNEILRSESGYSLEQFIDEKLSQSPDNLYQDCLRWMERILITKALRHTGGNQLQAAKILGITRGSLRNKLRDLGITIARTVASDEESAD